MGLQHIRMEKIEYFDFCRCDFMSLLELNDFAERLGYGQKVEIFYKVQGSGTLGSFEMLENDMDVFRMVSDGLRYRDVEMFMVVPRNR